jgi:hypothetical protein
MLETHCLTSSYDPPIVLLQEIVRHGRQFVKVDCSQCENTRVQEEGFLGPFTRLAAQLRMIDSYFDCAGRPFEDRFDGWPGRVRSALAELRMAFARVKRVWGWGHLDCPEPFRSEAIAERKRMFEGRRFLLLRCARAWVESDSGRAIDDPPDPTPKAHELAREATAKGILGNIDPWEASRAFEDLRTSLATAPCLGDCYPRLGEDLRARISVSLDVLERHVEMATAAAAAGPQESGPPYEPWANFTGPKKRERRMPGPVGGSP